jgi:hypothetical protein
MADTVADVLVRLGVDTEGLRAGFREARGQTTRFAVDLARIFSNQAGVGGLIGALTTTAGGFVRGQAGGILRGIGSLISAISFGITSLFRRAARNIANEIRRNFEEIRLAYRAGSLTLAATIEQLEVERANAIRRLSGRKGGRRELDRLLPQFDAALADLRARQQAIFEQFDASLELLRAGEAFRDVAAEVQDVIRQYRTYVDAGGDLARANEFLSRSLEQIRSQSAISLAEGEERAIEDALRLNQLLREREELLAESAEEERRILSRGVLERQRTTAQEKSAELEAVRRRRDERLAELDQDIRLLQLKVDTEARVFDLATDRVALETRLLELKAAEFDREVAQLAALRDIVAGIVSAPSGLFTMTPALRTQLNLGGVQIFVGESATPAQAQAAGEQVIEGMLRALVRERERLGLIT